MARRLERARSLPLDVFVPAPGADVERYVAPGSAIVGSILSDEMALIDYEGGIYGQAGFDKYETRVLHAAERHGSNYPTTARAYVDPRELVRVGTYDRESGRLLISKRREFNQWLARKEKR